MKTKQGRNGTVKGLSLILALSLVWFGCPAMAMADLTGTESTNISEISFDDVQAGDEGIQTLPTGVAIDEGATLAEPTETQVALITAIEGSDISIFPITLDPLTSEEVLAIGNAALQELIDEIIQGEIEPEQALEELIGINNAVTVIVL